MQIDKDKTIVVFRKFKDQGDILALFPHEVERVSGWCMSYQHVGQHSQADYNGCIDITVAATPEEYAPLARELKSIGYNLEVRKRYARKRN